MWLTFAIAYFLTIAAVYLPGILLLKGVRAENSLAVIAAPLITLPIYGIMCVIFGKLGVVTNAYNLILPVLAIAAIAMLIGSRRKVTALSFPVPKTKIPFNLSDMQIVGMNVVVGVVVMSLAYFFLVQNPYTYVEDFDNVSHLGSIRTNMTDGD